MLLDNELGQVYHFLSNSPRFVMLKIYTGKVRYALDPKSHVKYTDSHSPFYQTFC